MSILSRRAARLLPALAAAAAIGVTLSGAAEPSLAQGPPQPVKWTISLEPADGRTAAGTTIHAVVTATIDDGWHVYAPDDANSGPRPVHMTIVAGSVFAEGGTMRSPEPEREMDQAFGQVTASYTGEAVFNLPVTVAKDAPAGAHTLRIDLTFQACDGRMCLPPKVVKLEAPVTVQ